MKTTAEYLDAIVIKTGAKSDGAAGLMLGWTRSATSNYRRCKTAFDNHTCLVVARTLEIPLEQVIADMEIQREKDEKKKKDWLSFELRLKSAAASLLMTIGSALVTLKVTDTDATAKESTTYNAEILRNTNYANQRGVTARIALFVRHALNIAFRHVCCADCTKTYITV